VTATGSTTARTLANRSAEVISVKDFGAVGNCVTDDSAAINAAVAYLRATELAINNGAVTGTLAIKLVFPTACYIVNSTVNMTSLRNFPTIIDGEGSMIWGKTSGTPVVDAMNTRFFTMRDLTIEGDATATPNIGIMHGIISATPFSAADENYFERVNTQGFFTLTSWYNRNSEQSVWSGNALRNAYANQNSYTYIGDGSNYWNITSAFVANPNYAPHTAASFLFDTFINVDARQTGGGHTYWLNGTTGDRWIDGYAQTQGSTFSYGITGVPITGGGTTITSCTVTFPAPASGGVTATGTITLVSGSATGLVVSNPGSLYPNTPSALAPTITCLGGTAPTVSGNVTLVAQGGEPIVLFCDAQCPSDLRFDMHMEVNQVNNFLLSQTTTGPVTYTGISYTDREPLFSNAVFNNDSSITTVTFSNMYLDIGTPNFSGAVVFANPLIWTKGYGSASMTSTGMWNRPAGVFNMEIFGTLSALNMGLGSYNVHDPNGTLYQKGTICQMQIAGLAETGANALTGQNVCETNGFITSQRLTNDGGLRGGNGPATSWVWSLVGDGSGGLTVATGGTTLGGTIGFGVDSVQNVSLGLPSLATTATAGMPFIPSVAGLPTGTPTAKTGFSPVVIDTTDNKICFYTTAWKCASGL
jgi:hypothetical protein